MGLPSSHGREYASTSVKKALEIHLTAPLQLVALPKDEILHSQFVEHLSSGRARIYGLIHEYDHIAIKHEDEMVRQRRRVLRKDDQVTNIPWTSSAYGYRLGQRFSEILSRVPPSYMLRSIWNPFHKFETPHESLFPFSAEDLAGLFTKHEQRKWANTRL